MPAAAPATGPPKGGQRKSIAASLPAKQSVQLVWTDLTYDVAVPKKGTKRIIKGVSGHASPGQVLAIMGSSGAGKTTLLNLLSGRLLAGHLTGSIAANGAELKERKSFRKVAAFVTQDDLMLETQTPREVITFSACLRLSPATTPQERRMIIEDVIRLLHLESTRDGTPRWHALHACMHPPC